MKEEEKNNHGLPNFSKVFCLLGTLKWRAISTLITLNIRFSKPFRIRFLLLHVLLLLPNCVVKRDESIVNLPASNIKSTKA